MHTCQYRAQLRLGAAQAHSFAIDQDLAGVHRVEAVEDLHQGGLPAPFSLIVREFLPPWIVKLHYCREPPTGKRFTMCLISRVCFTICSSKSCFQLATM